MKDYYAILEVPLTASQEAIREQYLLLIQAWHPDKFPNPAQKAKAEEKCKEINIAYAVLKDAQKRARYDRDVRGAPSASSGAGTRRRAEERQHRPAQAAPPRPAEGQRQQAERAAAEEAGSDPESRAREEEEWIRIYFEQARRRGSQQPPARAKRNSEAPIRVLVVDDVAATRAHIRNLLSGAADIQVVGEAPDGSEAVQQFAALTPDVLIACVSTPSVDALSTIQAIRRKHPTAKIIVLSVPSFTGFIRRAAMAGACDYLVKPPAAEKLRLAVRLAAERPGSAP